MEKATGSTSDNYGSNPEEMEMLLNDLSPHISKDWRRFGRTLRVPSHEIDAIDQDYYSDTKEKAFQTLRVWHRGFNGGTTLAAKTELSKTLEIFGYKDMAQIIRGQKKHERTTTEDISQLNGYHDLDELKTLQLTGSEYSVSLENILKELATCETKTLGQKMQNLQNLQNMENLLIKLIENYEKKSSRDEVLKDLKKESRKRSERTRQAMRLTNYLLEQHQNGLREHRTTSETIKRCSSFAELHTMLRRNKTFTEGTIEYEKQKTQISSPIFVSKVIVEPCCSPGDNKRSSRLHSTVIDEIEKQYIENNESCTTKL